MWFCVQLFGSTFVFRRREDDARDKTIRASEAPSFVVDGGGDAIA